MRGDIFDVKAALQALLAGPGFTSALTAVIAEKQLGVGPSADVHVYAYERLTRLAFPMVELLAYQTTYTQDTQTKMGLHRVGVKWTVNEDTEEAATRNVEMLARATTDLLWDESGTRSGLMADFNINAGPLTVVEEDYSQLLPSAAQAFMKSVVVVVELTTWRD